MQTALPLADRLIAPSLARNVVLALVGSALLIASAKVQVPFWPVPMTMQTYAVTVIGMAYGWRLGAATVLLYLAQGAVGLPVFAGAGAGLGYFAGPTAGYLFGFVAAAALCGFLAERGLGRGLVGALVAMTLGTALILAIGTAWLAVFLGSASAAIAAGVVPFILASVVKVGLGAVTLPAAWSAVGLR